MTELIKNNKLLLIAVGAGASLVIVGFFSLILGGALFSSPTSGKVIIPVNTPQAANPTPVDSLPPEAPAKKYYDVVSVTDGDTIKVNIDGTTETLRLIGIDTPETVAPGQPVQCYGKEASDKMKQLVTGKKVELLADNTQSDRDKYDRLLRYVILQDGTDVQLAMIQSGVAKEYTYDKAYVNQGTYRQAETTAKNSKLGLWGATCSCEKDKEVSRSCNACNKSEVKYSNWDCSTYTKSVDDDSCTAACPLPAPAPAPVYVPQPAPAPSCCAHCSKGKACGDSCISKDKNCTKAPGCACDI